MKKLAITIAALLSLASTAQAEICLDVCTARIMPDVPAARMPLAGWVYAAGQNQNITILEAPQFGTWNAATESYVADPLFWGTGIDRMRIQIGTNPSDTRTLVFLTANPTITRDIRTYDPPRVFTALDTAAALSVTGKTNGVATIGGYVNASAVPPPLSGLPGSVTETVLLQLGEFAHLNLINSNENGPGFTAKVDFAPLNCGSTCETAFLPIPYNQAHEISLSLGFDSIEVPTANTLTLRLEVCQVGGVACQTATLPGLWPVNLSNTIALEVGILGGTTTNASQTVHEAVLWQSYVGPSTEAASFEDFTDGKESFWGQQGPISVFPTAQMSWAAEVNTTTLDPTNKGWLLDARPVADKRLRVLLDFDLTSLPLSEGDLFFLVHGQGLVLNGVGKSLDVLVRKLNGVYILRGRVIDDSGVTLGTPAVTLSTTKINRVALHFVAGTTPEEKGSLFVAVNGVGQTLGNVDNDQRVLESINFGVSTFTTSGNPGFTDRLLRFDNVTLVY